MITIRKGAERGRTQIDWLDGRHSFSFGNYSDPQWHHFRGLHVINDDRIAAGGGFSPHPHRDMEILTYVTHGSLAHSDSMGNTETIRAGEWQRMTAGTGIVHSEYNPSTTDETRLLQIWIMPQRKGLTPGYEQKVIAPGRGEWRPVAGPGGELTIHADARVLSARVAGGQGLSHSFAEGRGGWLHVVAGRVTVNGHELSPGDAVAIEREPAIAVTGLEESEVLLFDLG
jgi:hypothetical protein